MTVIWPLSLLPFMQLPQNACSFFAQVLSAADQQKPNAAGQRWFEKGWRPTTSADYADSSVAGGGRSVNNIFFSYVCANTNKHVLRLLLAYENRRGR